MKEKLRSQNNVRENTLLRNFFAVLSFHGSSFYAAIERNMLKLLDTINNRANFDENFDKKKNVLPWRVYRVVNEYFSTF